ncbi:MAG: hypothetical protein LW817_06010, partial [Candidatus Caenarcaniphilales bacterium]|nr:hypothetical protein [Candidatus Caenarcaniphilales bacterium]
TDLTQLAGDGQKLFEAIKEGIGDKDKAAGMTEALLSGTLKSNETAKIYGLDKISNEKTTQASKEILALATSLKDKNPVDIATEALKISTRLTSELPPEDKKIVNGALAKAALSSLDKDKANAYSGMIADFISNIPSDKQEAVIDLLGQAIKDTGVDKITQNPQSLLTNLFADKPKHKQAQTALADAALKTISDIAKQENIAMNPATLAALLDPTSQFGLFDQNGNINQAKLDKVAKTASCNILNNPQTAQERGVYTDPENIKKARDEAFNYINQNVRLFRGRATAAAASWTPGSSHPGPIVGETFKRMNAGFRARVPQEVKNRLSSSLSSINPDAKQNLQVLGQIAARSSQADASTIRVDDLMQLQNLQTLAPRVTNPTNTTPGVDPGRIKYGDKRESNGTEFHMFKDANDPNTQYYRSKDTRGQVKFAKSTDGGKNYEFLTNKQADQNLAKSFELYGSRTDKFPAVNQASKPIANSSTGLTKINDSTKLPAGINSNDYDVYSFNDYGKTSYALMPKEGKALPLKSIRQGVVENSILSNVYNEIKASNRASN